MSEETTIIVLNKWSLILLWTSILLAIIGSVAAGIRFYIERFRKSNIRLINLLVLLSIISPILSAIAVGSRYYVERYEKFISNKLTYSALERARNETFATQNKLAELQNAIASRHLSISQRNAMLPILRQIKGHNVAVAYRMMDGESSDFASDVLGVFRDAGCLTQDLIRTSLNDFNGKVVIVKHADTNPETIAVIEHAFKAARIPVSIENVAIDSIGRWYSNTTHVVIGRKNIKH